MSKYQVQEIEAKDFNPGEHPRDRNGRFIRKGVTVDLPKLKGGALGSGKVVGTRSRGRIEVEDDKGEIHVVKADQVQVIKRQPKDAGRPRSGVPTRPATLHARSAKNDELYSRTDRGDSANDIEDDVESERAYQAHIKNIEASVAKALKEGEATDNQFTLNGDGRTWDPERAKLHKQIVDELYLDAQSVPRDGKGLIAGGLGGAGKSTVLGKSLGIGKNDYFTVNPDDIKTKMADLDMIPKIGNLSPMEASPLVHEESSHIANMLAQKAYAERRNMIWDITMSSRGSVEKRVTDMRAKGYTQVDAVFVDIPVETSVTRALERHRRGMEAYDAGEGTGGRYVPPALIRANSSSKASSANREVFDELRDSFNDWSLFDNSGTAPKKVSDRSAHNKEILASLRRSQQELRKLLDGPLPDD